MIIILSKQLLLQVTILKPDYLHTVIWYQICIKVREFHSLYIYIFCVFTYEFLAQLYDIKYSYLIQKLHIIICFQVLLSNTNN